MAGKRYPPKTVASRNYNTGQDAMRATRREERTENDATPKRTLFTPYWPRDEVQRYLKTGSLIQQLIALNNASTSRKEA
uniref:Uncharacterized protein n=1 Tax=Romanomermis culicivorax TaxID=13658 RepID=A0A915JHW9_ROMCU